MFSGLRLRLTALYLSAALLVLALVGATAYLLLQSSFQATTALALRYRVAQEFQRFGAPLPPDLAAAAAAWSATHAPPPAPPVPTMASANGDETEGPASTETGQEPGEAAGSGDTAEFPESYDAELAAIYVLPLDMQGRLVARLAVAAPPLAPERAAVQSALAQGSDWRTVRVGGQSVEVATYRLAGPGGVAVLQAGRTLGDQDAVLRRLVMGLLILGGVVTVGLGAGSWWLAGRSLRPAQEAWARQQAFVANASHELRTPLTLLRASAEVTRRHLPAADARNRALLDDVLGECDHMARLVEDLLLLSKLDAHALVLQPQEVDLPAFLADLARQVGRLAGERGVRLSTEAGGSGTVWADPALLRQVLLILLDNALRHTPSGGCVRLEASSQGRHVCLTVADTGAGIAPEHLPHVFERFYRADQARTGGGSGLGLAIADGLITAHGGTIQLTSRPGAGTRVEVTLPARRS